MDGPSNPQRHLGLLSLAFLLLGLVSLIGGAALAIAGVAGGAALLAGGSLSNAAGISTLAVVAGVTIAAGGIPELVAAYGLSKRAPWARWLGIVFCTMALGAFPFGTAFGAWGLWLLLSTAGLRVFGVQRSWLGDAAAMLVGFFLMPHQGNGSEYRVDRRGRRRRRGRHGGVGALWLVLLVFGLIAFATCGTCVSTGAGVVTGAPVPLPWTGSSTTGMSLIPDVPPPTPMQGGMPSAPPVPPVPAPPVPPVPTPAVPVPPASPRMWTFVDNDGVTHIVDDAEKIPNAQRASARPFR